VQRLIASVIKEYEACSSAVDITVLLALSVYQLVVNETLPVGSENVPALGQYAAAIAPTTPTIMLLLIIGD